MTELEAIPLRPRRYFELKDAATKLDAPPAYEVPTRVKRRGDRLYKILWRGRQWAVTVRGVECRDGTYFIAKDRLWENERKFGWVIHMAGKNWVDIEDFTEALRVARIFAGGSIEASAIGAPATA